MMLREKSCPKNRKLASCNMDEQSKYDSEETESTSDVESCSCHGERRTGVRVKLSQWQQADRKTPELVTESDARVEV